MWNRVHSAGGAIPQATIQNFIDHHQILQSRGGTLIIEPNPSLVSLLFKPH